MGLLDQNNYAGYAQEGQRLAVEPMSFTPMDAARFVAEATPIIGDAMAAKEVYDELQKPNPNYAMVAALGGAALVGLVPGLGDAMASGIKKGARGLLDTAKRIEVDPNALGMSGGNVRQKKYFTAYHGSPHSFDKFDLGKKRTGAGAQAYGDGLYFSEIEGVAKKYRDDLSASNKNAAKRTLDQFDGDTTKAINHVKQKIVNLKKRNSEGQFSGYENKYNTQLQINNDKLAQLELYKANNNFNDGSMYQVNINANKEDFLDYNAPLSEQTGKVAEYIKNIETLTGQPLFNGQKNRTGSDLMLHMGGDLLRGGSKDPALDLSRELNAEGILGIKYKDPSLAGVNSSKKNYVVFNDDIIDIIKKYGFVGGTGLLGYNMLNNEEQTRKNSMGLL